MVYNTRSLITSITSPQLVTACQQSGLPSNDYGSTFTPDHVFEPMTTRNSGQATGSNVTITTEHIEYPPPRGARAIPEHFKLAPTFPSPFAGTLEASLDAILDFGATYVGIREIADTLLRPVESTTNWLDLLSRIYTSSRSSGLKSPRVVLEELLFLVTRTLLPEQITESRALMERLYDRKKHLAIRLVLRYDMLREWVLDSAGHPMVVYALPPADPPIQTEDPEVDEFYPHRRPLMPNVWTTLIAAPLGGYKTHGVRERMKHHITAVDGYLLLKDSEVADWQDEELLLFLNQVILTWQWMRANNEILEDMEVHGWEDLEAKADECKWIADDVKKHDRVKDLKAKRDTRVGNDMALDTEVEVEDSSGILG